MSKEQKKPSKILTVAKIPDCCYNCVWCYAESRDGIVCQKTDYANYHIVYNNVCKKHKRRKGY